MTNIELLLNKIKEKGYTITKFCLAVQMSRETFYNRIKYKGEFTATEIVLITQTLNLTRDVRDEIFFANKVELN